MTDTPPGTLLDKPSRPACAVRGVLYGGAAICGSVINASLCGHEGSCEHQMPQQVEQEQGHE